MNRNVHLRLVVIDVARSRMMQIIIDQRRHSRNVVHRWVVYVILHHPYGSDRCHSKMRSERDKTKQTKRKRKREERREKREEREEELQPSSRAL